MRYSEKLLERSMDEFNRWGDEINKLLQQKRLQMINIEKLYQQIKKCSNKAELLRLAAHLKYCGSLEDISCTRGCDWCDLGVYDISDKLYKCYFPVKAVRLEADTQDNESNLEVSPSIFKKLDSMNIGEFIIDIPDINRDNIKKTNSKLMLLGQAANIVPDKCCGIVSRSKLIAVFPDGKEAIWYFRLVCEEVSNGMLVDTRNYQLLIIPSKMPTMYTLNENIVTEKSCMETEYIKTRLAYCCGYNLDSDNYCNEAIPVIYKYNGDGKYKAHSITGVPINIEKHKLNAVTNGEYIKVSKRLREDKVNCGMAQVAGGSLNRIIDRCLYVISRYIA